MNIIKHSNIEDLILDINGGKYLLDRDVANLYGVSTKRINEAAKNNPARFPKGYMIEIDKNQKDKLVENFDRFKTMKHSISNHAFTERGLYMLATILKSPRATQTTLAIIDTFVGTARDALSPLHLRRQHGGQRNREGASPAFPADPDRHPQPLPGRQLSGHLHHLLHHRRTRPQFLRRL